MKTDFLTKSTSRIYTTSRISSHVLRRRPYGFIRRGEVALMEHA